MSRLNVLVLHQMGDPLYWRESVRALEYMIPECEKNINCIVHDSSLPFPEYLKELNFHLIVLGPTFLCNRYQSKSYEKVCKDYSFIKESDACKIALPQDDYDSSAVLDEWLTNWSVDRVYSVLADNLDALYPKYIATGGEIVLGYTGYISEEWIDSWKSPKPHHLRSIDVSYRTHDAEKNLCHLRNLKYVIASRFLRAIERYGADITTNISASLEDLIPGIHWHKFVEDSKFCLTTPSGSSLLDPYGDMRSRVIEYCKSHPSADFSQVSQNILQNNQPPLYFTAISPRNIEAALAQTVQIATPSKYSQLMKPHDHYIPIDEHCNNIAEVLSKMADKPYVENIQRRTKELFLSEPRLRRQHIVDEILTYAESKISDKGLSYSNEDTIKSAIKKYNEEVESTQKKYWSNKRRIVKIKKYCVNGLEKLKIL